VDPGSWTPEAWSAWGTWVAAAVTLLGVVGTGVGVIFTAKQAKSAKTSATEAKDARQMAISQVNLATEQAESARKQVYAATDQASSARESARIAEQALAEQREANRLLVMQLDASERHHAEEQAGAVAAAAQAALAAANRVSVELKAYTGNATVFIHNRSGTLIRDVRLIKVTGDELPDTVRVIHENPRGDHPEVINTVTSSKSGEFWVAYVDEDGQRQSVNAGQLTVVFRFSTAQPNQRWESSGSGDAVRVSDDDEPQV
jgi:hypothetical protein